MNHYTQILKSQARAIELFFLLVTIGGIVAYCFLSSDVYPELTFPRIAIIAECGDMSPQRVVVAITRPLEQAAGLVYSVRRIRSKTIRGAAELSVDFQEGTDMQYSLQQMQARIAEIRNNLPANTSLIVEKVTPAIFPVIIYNINSDTLTQADLNYQANYVIKPVITRVKGVARATVQGGDIEQVAVQVDPVKLEGLKISLSQISDAIKNSNQVQVLGKLNRDYQLNLVVGSEDLQSLDTLKNIVVGQSTFDSRSTPVPAGEPGSYGTEINTAANSAPVLLRDVATVTWGKADRTQFISANGKPGIALNIFRQPDSNVVAVSEGVKEAFSELRKHLPPGIMISPSYDESRLVVDAINNVRDAILTGIVLIVIVLYFFLREWRSTVIAAVTIPVSALASFGILKLLGQSLNLMSLGGLAVAIGLIIDDAVVVIENVDHQLREGYSPDESVTRTLNELIAPILSSTITTVVVFVPLGLLSGVAGQFFSSFTTTLSAAVVVSLVLSLTLTPTLASRWLKPKERKKQRPSILDLYPTMLHEAFSKPVMLSIAAIVLLVGAALLSTHLGSDFLPVVDEGSYMLDCYAPPGSSLYETASIQKVIEQVVSSTPEVKAFTRRTGTESGLYATDTNKGDMQVVLKPSGQRHRTVWQIMDEQRDKLNKLVPNANLEFHQILQDELNDLSGTETPINIRVFGNDPVLLRKIGKDISSHISGVPGLVDLIVSGQPGASQTEVQVDLIQAGRLGLSRLDVLSQVNDALLGNIATQIRRGDRLIDVRVRLKDDIRKDPSKLDEIPIIGSGNSAGKELPLGALAKFDVHPGEAAITRENQQRYISVEGNVEGQDMGSVINQIQDRIAKSINVPAGYRIEIAGTYESQQKAFKQLLAILCLGIALVYFVLLVQFKSWAQPLTIFTAIPLSLFGVTLALWVTRTTWNVSSMMGVILLVGLVVKNGIILIDFTNHLVARGLPLDEALIQAGSVRLRPILMTTICTLLGLLPLALGFGSGSELQKPLAIAVIGGLSLSTIFTLIFMPAVLRWIYQHQSKKTHLISKVTLARSPSSRKHN